jgi:hypothetical protein
MFSNVDPSQHLKAVIQNGQGQSISVDFKCLIGSTAKPKKTDK